MHVKTPNDVPMLCCKTQTACLTVCVWAPAEGWGQVYLAVLVLYGRPGCAQGSTERSPGQRNALHIL